MSTLVIEWSYGQTTEVSVPPWMGDTRRVELFGSICGVAAAHRVGLLGEEEAKQVLGPLLEQYGLMGGYVGGVLP